jgi:hypothetical protein
VGDAVRARPYLVLELVLEQRVAVVIAIKSRKGILQGILQDRGFGNARDCK